MKSAWDTLHPGRAWADNAEQPNPKSADEIAQIVIAFLEDNAKTKAKT